MPGRGRGGGGGGEGRGGDERAARGGGVGGGQRELPPRRREPPVVAGDVDGELTCGNVITSVVYQLAQLRSFKSLRTLKSECSFYLLITIAVSTSHAVFLI